MTEQEAIDYFNNVTIDTRIGIENIAKTSDLINVCIEALEKQIPIEASTMKYRNDYDWTCNNCDTTFKYIRYTADKPKYCPNCGQAIKWE